MACKCGKNHMAVKTLDRPAVKKIHERVDKAVKALAEMYGLQMDAKGSACRFGYDTMTIKYTMHLPIKGKGGKVIDNYGRDYENLAHLYGMKPEWLGQAFNDGKNIYTVTGFNKKARKSNIMIQRLDGKKFKCPPGFVIRYMAKGCLGKVK